jgi:hypothetical protein
MSRSSACPIHTPGTGPPQPWYLSKSISLYRPVDQVPLPTHTPAPSPYSTASTPLDHTTKRRPSSVSPNRDTNRSPRSGRSTCPFSLCDYKCTRERLGIDGVIASHISVTSGTVVVRDRLCRIWQLDGWNERRFVRPGAGSLGFGQYTDGLLMACARLAPVAMAESGGTCTAWGTGR